MKRRLSAVFAVLAVLLFGLMCAVVAYNYVALLCCETCSAPASAAFLLAVPFAAGIAVCAAVAAFLRRRP